MPKEQPTPLQIDRLAAELRKLPEYESVPDKTLRKIAEASLKQPAGEPPIQPLIEIEIDGIEERLKRLECFFPPALKEMRAIRKALGSLRREAKRKPKPRGGQGRPPGFQWLYEAMQARELRKKGHTWNKILHMLGRPATESARKNLIRQVKRRLPQAERNLGIPAGLSWPEASPEFLRGYLGL